MKELLHGTSCYITEVTITSRDSNKFSGRLTLEDSSTASDESHIWMATYAQGTGWMVTGDGVKLSNGERIRSTKTYPFSLKSAINDGVRGFLSEWLAKNRSIIHERKGPEAAETPAPPPPPPAPSSNGSSPKGIEIVEVLLAEVIPFEGQPRLEWSESDHLDMVNGLKQDGQKQLIIVTPITGIPGKRWKLVDGERRFRGGLAAGKQKMFAIVRRYASEKEMFWDSLTMNMHRRGHTPYECVRDIGRAMRDGKTVQEICIGTGLSDCAVYQFLQMQRLEPSLLELLRLSVPKKDRLSVESAKKLSRVPDQKEQLRIWGIAKKESTPSLRKLKVDELTAPILHSLPVKGRVRKPSDNAVRLLRVLQNLEAGVAFIERATDADLRAFATCARSTTVNTSDLLKRLNVATRGWNSFRDKVVKVA